MTHVRLIHLTKDYGRDAAHDAVSDLNLDVRSGQITALLGPSGCGKTTALKMIAGLLAPTRGDVQFDRQSVLPIPAERRGAVMVFQNYLLFPYMSVGDNVAFGLKMRGIDRETIRHKVAKMLALVKLEGYEGRNPRQLSSGQQQRVALARALVVEPKVLLLDEPLSNLDAHLRDEMRELICSIQRQLGITTIFVTHDQEEAVIMGERIAVLFDGQLQQYDAPRAFYERPASERVARFFGGVNFMAGVKHRDVVETALGELRVEQPTMPDGVVLLTIRPESIRLKDDANCNQLRGEIESRRYVGTHLRLKVMVGEHIFEVVTDIADFDRVRAGDNVKLHLPPKRIWLMPR